MRIFADLLAVASGQVSNSSVIVTGTVESMSDLFGQSWLSTSDMEFTLTFSESESPTLKVSGTAHISLTGTRDSTSAIFISLNYS